MEKEALRPGDLVPEGRVGLEQTCGNAGCTWRTSFQSSRCEKAHTAACPPKPWKLSPCTVSY